jgi:hypothetical protein
VIIIDSCVNNIVLFRVVIIVSYVKVWSCLNHMLILMSYLNNMLIMSHLNHVHFNVMLIIMQIIMSCSNAIPILMSYLNIMLIIM